MAKEQSVNFEAQLFKAADKLRKNIDAAEYKNVALGLIFLKYISESFQELHNKLALDEFSDPEDRDEYKAENIFLCQNKQDGKISKLKQNCQVSDKSLIMRWNP